MAYGKGQLVLFANVEASAVMVWTIIPIVKRILLF